jgi:hypothetical protein
VPDVKLVVRGSGLKGSKGCRKVAGRQADVNVAKWQWRRGKSWLRALQQKE